MIQSTLLLVAPALFAASIYMELGRIIRLVRGEKLSLVKVTLMTKIFVAGDVLSFLMQASGTAPTLPWVIQRLSQLRKIADNQAPESWSQDRGRQAKTSF